MAELKITIGAASASVQASDAVVADLVADYIVAYRGPTDATGPQKLRWFIKHLADHLRVVAATQAATTAAEVERERVLGERATIKFE